jgi:hypothetical protein
MFSIKWPEWLNTSNVIWTAVVSVVVWIGYLYLKRFEKRLEPHADSHLDWIWSFLTRPRRWPWNQGKAQSPPADAAAHETGTDYSPGLTAVNPWRSWPGVPLHDSSDLPEHRRWGRLFERHEFDWRVEHQDGHILSGPTPECAKCHGGVNMTHGCVDGFEHTTLACVMCNFKVTWLDPVYTYVVDEVRDSIEAELLKEKNAALS